MRIGISKLNPEHFFGMFLALFWGQDILFSFVRAVLIRIPYIKYVADYVVPMLMIMCLLLSLSYLVRSISRIDILFTFAVIIIYLLHMLLFPKNESLQAIAGTFFFTVFPLYFIGLRFDVLKHWRLLYIMSIINVWLFAIYYVLLNDNTGMSSEAEFSGYMDRAYILLPQLIIVLCETVKEKKFINILTSIVGFLLLLMCGNRGSVLIVLVFLAAYILFIAEKKKHTGIYAGLIAICSIICYYFKQLVIELTYLFARIGLSTRVLDRILEGTFFKSSGREIISDKIMSAIFENPIVGFGLAGDRAITGSYAHNYAIELWASFGVIVGTILLIATIYVIINAWIKTTDKTSKTFLLMLICTGFLKLFISSSFLQEGTFFLLLGVCVSQIRQGKRHDMCTKRGKLDESL